MRVNVARVHESMAAGQSSSTAHCKYICVSPTKPVQHFFRLSELAEQYLHKPGDCSWVRQVYHRSRIVPTADFSCPTDLTLHEYAASATLRDAYTTSCEGVAHLMIFTAFD